MIADDNLEAALTLDRIVRQAMMVPFRVGEMGHPLSVCIGIALAPTDESVTIDLVSAGELAVRAALQIGNGTTRYFESEMSVCPSRPIGTGSRYSARFADRRVCVALSAENRLAQP